MYMKAKIFILFFGVLFLISGCASDGYKNMLYDKKPAFYSYVFGNIHSDRARIERAADVYVTPSSCQKTVTALLAYKMFGADYHYETNLYVTKNGHQARHVVISFSGDPTLTSWDLVQLLKTIRGKTAAGKVLLNVSLFKTTPYSPNITIDDVGTNYAQPISSANIDHNLIEITVRPGKKAGGRRRAIVTNDSGYGIDSSITTTSKPSTVKLFIVNNRIQARGNICKNSIPLKFKISPMDLDYYLLSKIKLVLRASGVRRGAVTIVRDQSELPDDLVLWGTHASEALAGIVPPALKKSDNFVFDNLYLKIIHSQDKHAIEDWSDGSVVIKELVSKYFGVDMVDSLFVDGSGLSRYNKVQPQKLFELLKKGYDVREFVTALPSPGEAHTTLSKRTRLSEYIKAKTGNMSGISCLCGYSISKRPKAFVIVTHGFASTNKAMFPILDNFVNYHLEQ